MLQRQWKKDTIWCGVKGEIIPISEVSKNPDEIRVMIIELAKTSFKKGTYDFIDHNCNGFSKELCNR